MGLLRDRGRVIGHQHDAAVEVVEDIADGFIQIFDCFDLLFKTSEVTCLIGCLDMHIHEVRIAVRGLDCRLSFPKEVRVEIAGRSGDLDDFHAGALRKTEQQIDCRDDRSLLMIFFREGRHRRL